MGDGDGCSGESDFEFDRHGGVRKYRTAATPVIRSDGVDIVLAEVGKRYRTGAFESNEWRIYRNRPIPLARVIIVGQMDSGGSFNQTWRAARAVVRSVDA